MLLSQYFYYRKTATPTASAFSQPRSRAASLMYATSRERVPSRYRTLSAAAANVATTAAVLASQRNERLTSTSVHTRLSRRSLDGLLDNDLHRLSREDDGDVDEDALAMLADSINSEWSSRQKHVFWSKVGHPPSNHSHTGSRHGIGALQIPASLHVSSTVDDSDPLARGRTLQRSNLSPSEQEGHDWHRSEEESQRRRSSRVSRRGASMAFMGAWALFGIGTLGMHRYSADSRAVIQPGVVLLSSSAPPSLLFPSPTHESPPLTTVDFVFEVPPYESIATNRPPVAVPTLDRVIGRISAWACTTLYLTSRLPQIWKNVRL
jgi:solute carrier family 66 (lysosomal lysine-arginine transporter), member 1